MATQLSTVNSPSTGPTCPTYFPSTLSIETKMPKKRCCADDCKKKLSLIDFDCRCGNRFCGAHRHPEIHKCTFDHHAFAKAQLQAQLVKVDGQDTRIDRI